MNPAILAKGVQTALIRELALSTAGTLVKDTARSLATVMGLSLEDVAMVCHAVAEQLAGEFHEQQIPKPQG